MRVLTAALELIGAAVVLVSAGLISLPLAGIIFGAGLLALGLMLEGR